MFLALLFASSLATRDLHSFPTRRSSDLSKVTTEYPTPGQSVARKRVWGDFGTGGSRGIRTSHEYVRKGGASARIMLIQADRKSTRLNSSHVEISYAVFCLKKKKKKQEHK